MKILVDLKNKRIKMQTDAEDSKITPKELYSTLMDIFDEPEYMRYELPIEPTDGGSFRLINGWNLSAKAEKHLNGILVKESQGKTS